MVFIIAQVSLSYFGHVLKRDIFISGMHWKNFPKNFQYLSLMLGRVLRFRWWSNIFESGTRYFLTK